MVLPVAAIFLLAGLFINIQPAKAAGLVRLAGSDRINTAIKISKNAFADNSVSSMVLARSDAYPDALAAGPLAGLVNGPLLITSPTVLRTEVFAEILRIWDGEDDPGIDCYIIGGPSAISKSVGDILKTIDSNFDIRVIGGADRYDTSALISEEMLHIAPIALDDAVVVTGENFPDALSVSAAVTDYTFTNTVPILLTRQDIFPDIVANHLTDNLSTLTHVDIVGGTAVISDHVATRLEEFFPEVERIAGANRYETAKKVADKFITPAPTIGVSIASGENFPDALSGGVHAAMNSQPLLLVRSSEVPGPTKDYLVNNADTVDDGFVYGGTVPIPQTIVDELETYY